MQDMLVAQELDVSNLQDHVQSQPVACFLQHLGSFELLGREGRDDTRVRESFKRLDIVWVPFRVHSWAVTGLEVED